MYLEALAFIAMADVWDPLTRTAALSAQACDEAILRLWQLGQQYHPLVYELLLALHRRLYGRYDAAVWEIKD